jgi:hypothetical protein
MLFNLISLGAGQTYITLMKVRNLFLPKKGFGSHNDTILIGYLLDS